MTVKSIALFYGHVARNVGDIAINLGEVALLKSVYPDADITAVLLNARNSPYLAISRASFGPAGRVRLVEVSSADKDALDYAIDPARWLRHCGVEDADLVVLAAGEHLFSYADNDNLRSLFWRTLPAFAARLTGKRCLVMPSTFGPYETADGKALVTQLLETQPRIATRDARSREVLRALGTAARIDAGLDPAFFIEPPTVPARPGTRAIGLVMRSEHWGIRLAAVNRTVFDDDLRERDTAYRFSLALARKVLAESDREVRMFIQTETDRPIVEAVAQALGEAGAARFKPVVVNTIDDYLAALGEVDCVVASRFHALIFGMVCGKPGLGLYFDVHGHKIPGLMELLERPDDCINLSQTPIEQAVETAFSRFVAQTPDFAPTARRIEALRRETRKWLAEAWMNLATQDALTLSSSQALLKTGAWITAFARDIAYAKLAERDAARIAAVENSMSFKLGRTLTAAGQSPRKLVQLPREIWSLVSDRNSKQQAAAEVPPMTGYSRDRVARLWADRGLADVVDFIEAQHHADKTALRNTFISASRFFAVRGSPEAEGELRRRAIAIDESEASLKALHLAAERSGDLQTAWACIRRLKELYGRKPNRKQRAFLDSVRRSPACQLSLLDKIPASPQREISPVPNRICYVLHNSLPFSSGGYAIRARGLVSGLTSAGFEVVVQTRPGFPFDTKPELTASDVPLEETVEGVVHRRIPAPLRTGRSSVDYVEAAADALTDAFSEIRPSMVIAASNYQTALPALIAARRLGLPFIYEIRGFWEITRASREPEFLGLPGYKIQELLEAETAKRADHVFTLTGPMKQEMIRRGVTPEHITLLPNSCEPDRFAPRPRDEALAAKLAIPSGVPVIGYIGTFVQYEGLELLAMAAARLRDTGHEFRLLLVGNENVSGQEAGPITTEIGRIAQESGLADWLIMPGRVSHDEVEAYYSLVDIAAFPRKAQPVTEMVSPMKPLEAYAMEKAVVVSSVGALLEMVEDGRTGLVFEKDNVESLADVLTRLVGDRELRERLGREGRRWVEAERTWTATARIAADRIGSILGERRLEAAQANGRIELTR